MKREEMWDMIKRMEQSNSQTESNSTVDTRTKKAIPCKEYVALREVERRALTASKPTPGGEEDWDAEPTLPP